MTNKEILEIAMKQSAIESNCNAEDFLKTENKVVISESSKDARKYLSLPFDCDLTSYGNNIVASTNEELAEFVKAYIDKYPIHRSFETPNLHLLNEGLQKSCMKICFIAEYFLPDVAILTALECDYSMKVMQPIDFEGLYIDEWSNALCEKRKHLDALGIGAFDKGKLIGLAACSADCETMWQIGIDVLPQYRQKGIAAAITSRLALEIIDRGKVPFYCAAWSNIKSVRNAIKSGFRPAWVQMTAKSEQFVAEMQGECLP